MFNSQSQSAFVRGFIDDAGRPRPVAQIEVSQSAFVRGFIDDALTTTPRPSGRPCLNPRSCAASSMT